MAQRYGSAVCLHTPRGAQGPHGDPAAPRSSVHPQVVHGGLHGIPRVLPETAHRGVPHRTPDVPELGDVVFSIRTAARSTSTSSGERGVMKASPGLSALSIRTDARTDACRDDTRTSSPATTSWRSASSGDNAMPFPGRESKPPHESGRPAMPSRIGYRSSTRSAGGSCCTIPNGARLPRLAGSFSHNRPCRYGGSSRSASGQGHWRPRCSRRRAYVIPEWSCDNDLSSSQTASESRYFHSWPFPSGRAGRRPGGSSGRRSPTSR